MTDKLSPERAVRLLRAKAGELEVLVRMMVNDADLTWSLMADVALIASLLADHIERTEVK